MFFASDNAGPIHPQVMKALEHANEGFALPYGADILMDEVRDRIRTAFEAPDAAIYLVATGTSANALALATYCQPWQTIFCTPVAHINEDECNAPEFFSGGAKLTLISDGDKMSASSLDISIKSKMINDVHIAQPGPVSITQATERGSVYSLDEIRALSDVAKRYGLPVHLDGARFSNALVALGCSAADMTWKSGIDVVSFGGTKNGLMGVEAVVFFDPAKAWEFELRRKRAGHLFSKHRYLSAQMAAYLRNDLWLESARSANMNCARLSAGLRAAGADFMYEPQANMVFARLPRAAHQRLNSAGAIYELWDSELEGSDAEELIGARLVCDWSLSHAQIDQFVDIIHG